MDSWILRNLFTISKTMKRSWDWFSRVWIKRMMVSTFPMLRGGGVQCQPVSVPWGSLVCLCRQDWCPGDCPVSPGPGSQDLWAAGWEDTQEVKIPLVFLFYVGGARKKYRDVEPMSFSPVWTFQRLWLLPFFLLFSILIFLCELTYNYKIIMLYWDLLSVSLCWGEVLAPELICIPVWLSCCPELAALERDCAVALWKCWVLYACGTNMLTTTYLCCFLPLFFPLLPSLCLFACVSE